MTPRSLVRKHGNGVVAAQDRAEFDAERMWVSGGPSPIGATTDRVRVRVFNTMELDEHGCIVAGTPGRRQLQAAHPPKNGSGTWPA